MGAGLSRGLCGSGAGNSSLPTLGFGECKASRRAPFESKDAVQCHEGASKSATGTFLDSTTSGGGSDSGTDDEESEQIELEVWVGPDGKEYHVDRETHVIYDGNGEEAGKWNPDWPIPEPEPGTFELGTGAQWDNALEDTESSSSGSNF